MKLSTKKTLFTVAGIWMFVGFALSILVLLGLVFSFDTIADQYIAFIETYMGYDIESLVDDMDLYLTIVKIVAIVANWVLAMFLVGVGALYMRRAKMTQEQLEAKKTSTVVWSAVTIIFISLVPGILGLIAALSGVSEEEKLEKIESEKVVVTPTEQDGEIAKKIAELKKLKKSGAISGAEYEKLLAELIK